MFIIQFLRDWKYHRIKNTIAKLYRYPRYHLFISVYIFDELHQRNELKKKNWTILKNIRNKNIFER